jgi:hypothetical protein
LSQGSAAAASPTATAPPRAEPGAAPAPQPVRQGQRGRHLGEHEAGVVDERRRERGHPARRLGQPVPARERAHPLADLPRQQRGDERQEDGHGRVAPQGPGREDQDGQPDGVQRVDRPVLPPDAVVRLERRVVEGPVPALRVVALEGEVPVPERLSATIR